MNPYRDMCFVFFGAGTYVGLSKSVFSWECFMYLLGGVVFYLLFLRNYKKEIESVMDIFPEDGSLEVTSNFSVDKSYLESPEAEEDREFLLDRIRKELAEALVEASLEDYPIEKMKERVSKLVVLLTVIMSLTNPHKS